MGLPIELSSVISLTWLQSNKHNTFHLHSAAFRFKRGSLTDEAERILRQGSSVDINNVGQLVDLVERNKAEECLARVICELSNNARIHGDGGARFAQSLLKFRQSKHAKVKQYLDAMTNGAKAKSNDQCRGFYPRCNHSTNEVINVGNKLLRSR